MSDDIGFEPDPTLSDRSRFAMTEALRLELICQLEERGMNGGNIGSIDKVFDLARNKVLDLDYSNEFPINPKMFSSILRIHHKVSESIIESLKIKGKQEKQRIYDTVKKSIIDVIFTDEDE